MSKLEIASGIISIIAIDKKSVPEKVIAIAIIWPYLKHDKLDMHLPKMTTSRKNATMRAILITIVISIIPIIWI